MSGETAKKNPRGSTWVRWARSASSRTSKKSPQSTWVVVYGEYKPRPDWIIRLEAQGASMRNVKRIREVYRGVRDPSRLNFIDVRDLEWGGSLYLRVRKVFG